VGKSWGCGGMGGLTAKDTASAPDAAQGAGEGVTAVGGHGGLGDLQWLAESCDLIAIRQSCVPISLIIHQANPDSRQSGSGQNWHVDTRVCGMGMLSLTSKRFRPAPRSRLLNLTGFFSSVGG
jgi:hypothetical protein